LLKALRDKEEAVRDDLNLTDQADKKSDRKTVTIRKGEIQSDSQVENFWSIHLGSLIRLVSQLIKQKLALLFLTKQEISKNNRRKIKIKAKSNGKELNQVKSDCLSHA